MGNEIQEAILQEKDEFALAGGAGLKFEGAMFQQGQAVTVEKLAQALDRVDLVLDFSTTQGNKTLFEACQKTRHDNISILLGTTGLSQESIDNWKKLVGGSERRLLFAPNTSIGILLLAHASLRFAGILKGQQFDVEIIETHHRDKMDSPSGTARFVGDELAKVHQEFFTQSHRIGSRKPHEIGIHAVRGGSVFGEHEVRFLGDFEEISIRHRALSRTLFAKGAIVLSKWLMKQQSGYFGLMDVNLDML